MKDSVAIMTRVEFTIDDDEHGGRIVVADPCYVDKDDGDTPSEVIANRANSYDGWGAVLDKAAGEWIGEVVILDDSRTGWGERVATLRLTRKNRSSGHYNYLEYVGEAGVDSGQMYAAGVEHLPVDYDVLLNQYPEDPVHMLASQGGIVSSTGYGDGVYAVLACRNSDGRLDSVEVRFIDDEDEDEED